MTKEYKIKILHSGDEPQLEAYLRPRMASSMFLFNNLRRAGFDDFGERFQGTYAAHIEDGHVKGVLAHYWNGMLILQATSHLDVLLQAATDVSGRKISGLLGLRDQVDEAQAILSIDPASVRLNEVEGLFLLSLDKLRAPVSLESGEWL